MEIVTEFMICQDCAMVVANAEDGCEESCTHADGLSVHTTLAGDEVDFYAPWKPCPGCGTTLAGAWFPAVELA